jgi:hypothetical protein
MNFFSQPFDLFYGREWVKWRKKGLMRECRGNFSKKATISWEMRGSEMGQSFVVLMIICEMRPQQLFYMKK